MRGTIFLQATTKQLNSSRKPQRMLVTCYMFSPLGKRKKKAVFGTLKTVHVYELINQQEKM